MTQFVTERRKLLTYLVSSATGNGHLPNLDETQTRHELFFTK